MRAGGAWFIEELREYCLKKKKHPFCNRIRFSTITLQNEKKHVRTWRDGCNSSWFDFKRLYILHYTSRESVRKPRPTDVQMRIILRPTRSRYINNNNITIWQTCAYHNNYFLLRSREAQPRAILTITIGRHCDYVAAAATTPLRYKKHIHYYKSATDHGNIRRRVSTYTAEVCESYFLGVIGTLSMKTYRNNCNKQVRHALRELAPIIPHECYTCILQ